MKMVKKLLSAGLFAAMILSVGMVANAEEVDTEVTADAITIDSVTFAENETDNTLVDVTVAFTAVDTAEEVTILMATQDAITTTNTDDVMYINQVEQPEEGVLTFVVEKSRILASTEAADVNNTTMYVKMGGTDIDTMASKTEVLSLDDYTPGDVNEDEEVNSRDALAILRYEANWPNIKLHEKAADVNADDEINSRDALAILRYEANWPNIELKKAN